MSSAQFATRPIPPRITASSGSTSPPDRSSWTALSPCGTRVHATTVRDLAATIFYDPQVKAEGASIEVRNTGGRAGLAQTVADRLAERSFTVSIVTNGSAGRSAVLVRNSAKRYTANALAQQLGGLPVDAFPSGDPTSADIVVRVGSDWKGLATDLGR